MNNWQKVINVCLAVIVTLLIFQNQQLKDQVDTLKGFAKVNGMNKNQTIDDRDFKDAVEDIIEDCIVDGSFSIYISDTETNIYGDLDSESIRCNPFAN